MTGFNGRVSCSYEVEQKLLDFEVVDTIIWLYEEYGDEAAATFQELENLTNPVMDLWIPA